MSERNTALATDASKFTAATEVSEGENTASASNHLGFRCVGMYMYIPTEASTSYSTSGSMHGLHCTRNSIAPSLSTSPPSSFSSFFLSASLPPSPSPLSSSMETVPWWGLVRECLFVSLPLTSSRTSGRRCGLSMLPWSHRYTSISPSLTSHPPTSPLLPYPSPLLSPFSSS